MAQSLPMLFMLVALVAMWFFMSRSQKKQQQERKKLIGKYEGWRSRSNNWRTSWRSF